VADQRKNQRFDLRLPVELVRASGQEKQLTAETRNLGSGGVFIHAEEDLNVGDTVEYIIHFPSTSDQEQLRLRCVGRVIRREADGVAATMDRYEYVRSRAASAGE
jgi:hypothetical protein